MDAVRLKGEAVPPGVPGGRSATCSVISLYTMMYWRRLRSRIENTLPVRAWIWNGQQKDVGNDSQWKVSKGC